MFDNDDFGFRKITVERPLRLNFQASPERIARLEDETAFQNLAKSRKKGERGQKEVEEGQAAAGGNPAGARARWTRVRSTETGRSSRAH